MIRDDLSNNPTHAFSRRTFLWGSVSAAFAAMFAALDLHPVWAAGGDANAPLVGWNKTTFAPHVNQNFTVNSGAGSSTLKLIAVKDLPAKIYYGPQHIVAAKSGDCFALVFSSTVSRRLKPRTYQFQHSKLGQFSLFITPSTRATDGQHYEAVINHVRA